MLYTKRMPQLCEAERDQMRAAGRFNAQLMDFIRDYVKPGITTGELDKLVHDYTLDHGHKPACLGYKGFPRSCCISINEVVCHGIPDDRVLEEGDIANIDITSIVDGWYGDQSETFLIGEVSNMARALAQCAFDCMYLGIEATSPNCRVSDIGEAIVREASHRRFHVVKEYVGHCLGTMFHMEPSIPHAPTAQSRRDRLPAGVCFTVEPMINEGTHFTVQDKRDGWTVRTKDGRLSAQFEHTVLMTEEGPEILTLTQRGPQRGDKL